MSGMKLLKTTGILTLLQFGMYIYASGQQLTSYNLQFLPQRSYMNPSFAPIGKMHIGIPVFSGVSNSYTNNGFTYSDLFRRTNDNTLILDFGNAINNMAARNYMTAHAETELVSFGMKYKKNYFSFNITEKADLNFNYSKSFMEFMYEGNAASLGTVQQLNPGLEAVHYREYGLAWAKELSKMITAGVRVKYLYGMEQVITKGKGITMYTDPVDFTITANTDYTIFTSGLDSNAFNNFEFGNYVTGRKNTGYAIDAGITLKPVQTIELTASVIDLGNIKWVTNNAIYHTNTNQENFVYTGINLDEFINSDSLDAETYLQTIGDSLYDSFNMTTTSESYTYKLPIQFYFSASYLISPRYKVTALVRNKSAYHTNYTDYQFSFTGKSKTWLNYTVSINKVNKTTATPGGGFAINFRNNQIYFASDNVPGLFNWKHTHNSGFRAGLNIMFGTWLKYMKPPQPKLEEPSAMK